MRTNWNDLSEQVKSDLTAWYNVRDEDLTQADKNKLATLYGKGQFHAWDCPACGGRVYDGNPDDWGEFQGVCQVDYMSYPGDPDVFVTDYLRRMCDECRSQGYSANHQETREAY